ncbi:dTDP-4-dehydrorhamnose 3,5-epimerase RmlC [Gordonia polyisoprenivorans VH2]|uniref:dTDP-4-dehydrorhamnose 3,5-epimerase RmlC n=1 Tax=Gordonia polyisoprenivorans (strain DSM 44266 / VH2) TaxID=1112204 RepID=H6N1F9_GORPV|nr:dTDP-4-dehydrorhamnose 3,5-epimerase RmlC [Gordonia polyisoprenivorans VH2]
MFTEAFKADVLADAIGHRLDLAQVNLSVSAAGVLRGVHFADVPPGQAKYVTCAAGAILDVIVDIRVGSPTFGSYDTVLLDDVERRAVYLSEGLGHAFCALADDSTVTYLCSTGYNPGAEHGINPMDPELGIDWPTLARDGSPLNYELSAKDTAAPGLRAAREGGLLPQYDEVKAYLATLH